MFPGTAAANRLPSDRSTCIWARMVSMRASSLMGSTRIEIPPVIPRTGLKVFSAVFSPPGTKIRISTGRSSPASSKTSVTAASIILRGTELMAAAPTGWSRPAFVTRPTPSPPSMITRRSRAEAVPVPWSASRAFPAFSGRNLAWAKIRRPSVTSGSSPASFFTAQEAAPFPAFFSISGTRTIWPAGVMSSAVSGHMPETRKETAPWAARAAQVPVVYPRLSIFLSL